MDAKIIPLPQAHPVIYSLANRPGNTLPLFETAVRAGFPSPAQDYNADQIDLNTYFTNNKTSTFLVEVEGDSLIGAHIEPKDLAVVDVSLKPEDGKIVIAYLSGEFTMKRLRIEKDATWLMPENPKYRPIAVTEPDMGLIWGVVVGILKRV